MRALSIDLWDKKCWLAVQIENISIPHSTVSRVSLVNKLKDIFKKELDIDTIVVWLPYDLQGFDTRQFDKTNKFILKLKNIFKDKSVIWFDERFTSIIWWNIIESIWLNQDKKDEIAAALILESFLEKNKNS